jgi:hypothetical protein
MSVIIAKLQALKLSLSAYLFATLAGVVGILLLVIGYKNKQLHGAQVSLLKATYGSRIEAMNNASFKAAKLARSSYDKYMDAKIGYEKKHGRIK